MKRCGMYKFFCAIMWIEVEMLGLDKNTDFAPANKKAGQLVLHEMLCGGNFGKSYSRDRKSILAMYAEEMVHNFTYAIEFPSEPLCRPFTLVWDFVNKRIN